MTTYRIRISENVFGQVHSFIVRNIQASSFAQAEKIAAEIVSAFPENDIFVREVSELEKAGA
jgi:hypothetical protein